MGEPSIPGGLADEGFEPMRLPSLRRPSPSMAVSVMALVVASTGTSYATGLIGSDDIRNNAVQSKDIKDRTIKGRDIKNDVIGSRSEERRVGKEWRTQEAAGEGEDK